MKPKFDHFRIILEKVPDTVRRHRWKMWVVLLVMTGAMVVGAGRIKMDASLVNSFKADDPVKIAYDRFRETFGSDEVLYLVYEARDGDVFSRNSLEALRGIQEDLLNYRFRLKPGETSPLDHITKITSISNVSYLESRDGALVSRDFIGRDIPASRQERSRLKARAAGQPDYPLVYFSKDHRFGGIIVETDYNAIPMDSPDNYGEPGSVLDEEEPSTEDAAMGFGAGTSLPNEMPTKFKQNLMDEYVPFMAAVSGIIKKPEYREHLTFYPVGTPPWNSFIHTMVLGEMGRIALGTVVLISLFTGILFRSLSAVAWLLLVILVSLIWVLGTIGWSGAVMSDLLMMIVFFVLAVGVADAIHILSGYLYFRRHNHDHAGSLRRVFKKSGLACFLTSLTTAAGFLSMLFLPIASMQKIGLFSAVGVVYAFGITIFMLPLLLEIKSPVPTNRGPKANIARPPHLAQSLLHILERFVFSHTGRILVVFAGAGLVLFMGVFKVRVESSNVKIIRPGLPIRQAFDLADQVMAGTQNLEVLVDTGQADGLKDPGVLTAMDGLQRHVASNYGDAVTNTMSLVNVTKDSFKALNNDDENFYTIPRDAHVLAQTVFLFDNANPIDRRRLVSDDYRIGRIIIRTKSMGSTGNLRLMDSVHDYIAEKLTPLKERYPGLDITVTGQLPLTMKVYDYLTWSFVLSFIITIGVVSLILLFVMDSLKTGLIALVPNLFPVLTVLGVMGFFNIPLDIHTLMVVPILIGIAVDDTIHFITHFRIEMRNHGDTRTAIVLSLREVGQAILFTSLVLSIGFLMFTASKNMGFAYFGLLNAVAIFGAVMADLVLLPAFLCTCSRTVGHRDGDRAVMAQN